MFNSNHSYRINHLYKYIWLYYKRNKFRRCCHLWRHGRTASAGELTAPMAIPVRGGRLGLAGELFHPGGGAQAAYLSGRALAERLAKGGDA